MITNNDQESTKDLTTEEENIPQLYSKRVILSFCAFFSVMFGGVLLMRNLSQVGNKKGQAVVFIFSFFYMILVVTIMTAFELSPNLTIPFNVAGAALLNEFFWNRYLGDIEYEKKNWYKPAIISFGIALVLFLLIMSTTVSS